jgi:putative ABC transport system permease protein
MLSGFSIDIRHAARRLAARPGFAAAAVLTIALGVGLNTGAFSILNGVFFSDLPVPAGDEIVDIFETVDGLPGRNEKGWVNARVTTREYEAYRDGSRTLVGLAGYSVAWPATLRGEQPREITGRYVTCEYFDVLRQPPAIGRELTPGDCTGGAAPVIVLGHDLWKTAFAANPQVVGRTVTLNRAQVTVVGVAAEDAFQPDLRRLDYFAPISAQPFLRPDRDWLVNEEFGWLTLMGRRSADATIDDVRAELGVITARIDAEQPGRRTAVDVHPARQPTARIRYGDVAQAAFLVLAPFGLVLLLACANVANLFLARANERAPEIAMRFALGASRARVVQALLVESLLVSIVGGVIGTLVAFWSFKELARLLLPVLPAPIILPGIEPDLRVLSFGLTVALVAGVLAGLGPAMQITTSLAAMVRRGSTTAGHRGASRLQGVLMGLQVAVCAVLLTFAGLLLRGLYNANTVDPGFAYERVIAVSGDLRDFGYVGDDLAAFQRRLAQRVEALPGVAAVGYTARAPWDQRSTAWIARAAGPGGSEHRRFERSDVGPGYFAAVGIPIVRGRAFAESELIDDPTVVIVTQATAAALWPEQDPVGQTLLVATGQGRQDRALTVVGVARDAQVHVIGEIDSNVLYAPSQPRYRHMLTLVVRSRSEYASVAARIRNVLQALDPSVSMRIAPLEDNLDGRRQLSALLSGLAVSVGALALVLAAVGIFAVVSYVVSRRTREIGIRLALGAKPRDVLRAILGRTLQPVAVGAGIGGAAAAAGSTVLSSMLFGVSPVDPVGVGGAVVFVLAVAVVAGVVPARRGLGVDPTVTLRYE